MEHTEAAKKDFLKALVKVQGLIEPAKKDSTNPHFKSKYASLGAVNESVMGPLTENGFAILSGGHDINGKPYLRTTLYHVGGHEVSFDYPLIEKSENPQHIASSVTYARRYSICALLNLSVEDDDGSEAARTHTPATTQTTAAQAVAAAKAGADEWHTAQFVPVSVVPRGNGWDITDGEGVVYGTLNKDKSSIAQHAALKHLEISISFVNKGKFKSIGKISLAEVGDREPAEIPF